MNRNSLFDKVFIKLYQQRKINGFFPIYTWVEKELGINDEIMLNDIIENMLQLNWIEHAEYSKYDVSLTYIGRSVFEKFGSYSSFEKSKNSDQKKVQRRKTVIDFIKIGSAIIFGLSTAILGWTKYHDDKTIQEQIITTNELNMKIIILENKIDSLKTIISIHDYNENLKELELKNNSGANIKN